MVCSLKGPVTKFSTAILISNVLFSFHLFCSDFFCSFLLNKDYVLENAKFCSFIGNNTFVYSFLVLILTEFLLFGALFCGKSSLFASNYGFYHSLCYFPDISELTFCNTLILSACAYYLSSYYLYSIKLSLFHVILYDQLLAFHFSLRDRLYWPKLVHKVICVLRILFVIL